MHHRWVYPIAIAHHYAEVAEAAMFMLPPIIPPVLLGSHITIVWAIVLLTQLGGILGHSGFMIPVLSNRYTTWIPFINSEYHDLHHLRYNVNYGAVWPIVDMIFGTYREEPIIYKHGFEAELAVVEPKVSEKQSEPKEPQPGATEVNVADVFADGATKTAALEQATTAIPSMPVTFE